MKIPKIYSGNENIYPFELELSKINEENIRKFTEECLRMAPDYFFQVPSSLSGKYHPNDERGFGGLLLHTKRVFKLCVAFTEFFACKTKSLLRRDMVLSAAILHDSLKCGVPPVDHWETDPQHPYLPRTYYLSAKRHFKGPLAYEYIYYDIMHIIECHMWIYSPKIMKPRKDIEKEVEILQLADYVASQEFIKINSLWPDQYGFPGWRDTWD